MKSSRCWEMRNIMSELHETRDEDEWKSGLQASIIKNLFISCVKRSAEPSSQPAAHTETQRPPAKPLAGLYSTILSASQSRQGAAGGEELCWIEEVDRLHGSGRSCLWLTEEPNSEGLRPNRQADYDVESFWLSASTCLVYCRTPNNTPHPQKVTSSRLLLSHFSSHKVIWCGEISGIKS